MWWGLNINILECLAQNSHSKNGAFKNSVNPLLHPIHTINLQIEILPPKSTYTCLLCVHPCCCHVVQVPATSDLQYCFFISVPQFLLSHDPVHSPFYKVVFSQNMYVCSCPLCFPSLIAFLPQTPARAPEPSSSTSFSTSLQSNSSPLQGAYSIPLPFLHWGNHLSLSLPHLWVLLFSLLMTTFPAKCLSLVNSLLRPQVRRPFPLVSLGSIIDTGTAHEKYLANICGINSWLWQHQSQLSVDSLNLHSAWMNWAPSLGQGSASDRVRAQSCEMYNNAGPSLTCPLGWEHTCSKWQVVCPAPEGQTGAWDTQASLFDLNQTFEVHDISYGQKFPHISGKLFSNPP